MFRIAQMTFVLVAPALFTQAAFAADKDGVTWRELTHGRSYVAQFCSNKADNSAGPTSQLNRFLSELDSGQEMSMETIDHDIAIGVHMKLPLNISAPAYRDFDGGSCVAVTISKPSL